MPKMQPLQYPLEYAQPDLLNPGRRSNPNYFFSAFPFVPSPSLASLLPPLTNCPEVPSSMLFKKKRSKGREGDDHITVTETGAVTRHGTRCGYNCRVRAKERTPVTRVVYVLYWFFFLSG